MQKNNRLHLLLLSLLTPVLCTLAWPTMPFAPLLFFAFVPLLIIEQKLLEKRFTGVFYGYLYLSLFLFNLGTTWWVWNASPGGALFMLFANTLLMTLPFMAYRFTKQVLNQQRALLAFVLYWLCFEYIHFQWDIAYPWLTLGNGFAHSTALVQWFEYTGALGGSLWILLLNVFIFSLFTKHSKTLQYTTIGLVVVPFCWSMYLGQQGGCKPAKHELVVVQPNIDPYNKFEGMNEIEQVKQFLALAEKQITPKTELVVLPETAIVEYMDEDNINEFRSIQLFQELIERHPHIQVLTGASTYRFFKADEKLSVTARLHESSGLYYDSYNTALLIDSTGVIDIYHKSKLVPGTEKMPYPGFFKILGPLAIDLGGVSGSLGVDTTSKVFTPDSTGLVAAPLICYESVFGGYVSSFVRKDANLLFVITNDSWWGNTPGYRHHKDYARLRAIENRRYVVRAANTGISCVINDNGEVLQETKWWEATAFRCKVPALRYQTFYAKHGDYLGRIAAFLSLFFFLSVVVKRISGK